MAPWERKEESRMRGRAKSFVVLYKDQLLLQRVLYFIYRKIIKYCCSWRFFLLSLIFKVLNFERFTKCPLLYL